jgi:hypothetical protein
VNDVIIKIVPGSVISTQSSLRMTSTVPFFRSQRVLRALRANNMSRLMTHEEVTRITNPVSEDQTNSNISEQDKQFPLDALTSLGPKSEMLRGTRFLGQPAGGPEFVQSCPEAKSTDYVHATTRLLNRLTNTQTQCSLFKNCTQSTIPHLLASDVHHFQSGLLHSPHQQ